MWNALSALLRKSYHSKREVETMARHIGIVGCSAPGAALCYETICTEGASLLGKYQPPFEISMHTHPFSEYMRRIEDDNWEAVAELMLSSAEKLASIGAEFLVAPCNTIHLAIELATPRSPLPWLHIAEEVAREAKQSGYQRVALLGTRLLMESPLYPAKFGRASVEYRLPAKRERERIDRFIFDELVYNRITPEARSYILKVVERLREEGCDAVGMCCTELPLLLRATDTSLPLLDSTKILARAALKRAIE
jgi:aspartate racemase